MVAYQNLVYRVTNPANAVLYIKIISLPCTVAVLPLKYIVYFFVHWCP